MFCCNYYHICRKQYFIKFNLIINVIIFIIIYHRCFFINLYLKFVTDLVFSLLRVMCKELFRNVNVSLHILQLLYRLLDHIFVQSSGSMKDNCIIMVKGYLSRCQKLYYPPKLAAVIYKCAAKINIYHEKLGQATINYFNEAILQTMNSDVNSLRLYCCYLLSRNVSTVNSDLNTSLLNIFLINVSF